MIKITQYQAFDGTVFNNEDECLKYERKSKLTNNTYLQIWSHNQKEMGDPLFNLCPDKVWYVKCNKEGMDYFNYLCENDEVVKIIDKDNLYDSSDILYWYWDDDKYKWINFDTRLQYVKDCCKMFDIPLED